MKQTKYLIWLIVALIVIFSPSVAQAQNFVVWPAEVRVDNLSPGEKANFNLTIRNKDDASHIFILTTYGPRESERREGRDELPDGSWISFSPQRLEVGANSSNKVEVTVAIPQDEKWSDKDWEIWLRVAPEEREFLVVNYYIRLLVSTGEEVVKVGPNIGLIIGIFVGILLLGYVVYYFRCRAKPKHP